MKPDQYTRSADAVDALVGTNPVGETLGEPAVAAFVDLKTMLAAKIEEYVDQADLTQDDAEDCFLMVGFSDGSYLQVYLEDEQLLLYEHDADGEYVRSVTYLPHQQPEYLMRYEEAAEKDHLTADAILPRQPAPELSMEGLALAIERLKDERENARLSAVIGGSSVAQAEVMELTELLSAAQVQLAGA